MSTVSVIGVTSGQPSVPLQLRAGFEGTDLVDSKEKLKAAFDTLEDNASQLNICNSIVHSGSGEYFPFTDDTHCLVFKNRKPGDSLYTSAQAAIFVVDMRVKKGTKKGDIAIRFGFGGHGERGCWIPESNQTVIRFPDCPTVLELQKYFEIFLIKVLPTVAGWSNDYVSNGGPEQEFKPSSSPTMTWPLLTVSQDE